MITISHEQKPGNVISRFQAIEMNDLETLSAPFPHLVSREISLEMTGQAPSFFDDMIHSAEKGRRGEVVMVIRHSDGRIWLHTKHFYPGGVYRLPTGGVDAEEPALHAACRELWEETGLRAEPTNCLGILRYRLERAGVVIPFVSYIFLFQGGKHEPVSHDPDEKIAGFKLVSPAQLAEKAQALRLVPLEWRDWGDFRALSHEFLFERRQYL